MKALLFPGQGVQKVGMLDKLFKDVPEINNVIESVSKSLDFDLEDLLRNVVTLYTSDRNKDKLLEEKVGKQERLINTSTNKSNRLGRGSSSSSSSGLSSRSSRSITRKCQGKYQDRYRYDENGMRKDNAKYKKDRFGLCVKSSNAYYGGAYKNKKSKKSKKKKTKNN